MKKLGIAVLVTSVLSSASFAYASSSATLNTTDPNLKLEGAFTFQSGLRSQKGLSGDDRNVSKNRHDFGFLTSASFMATLSKQTDCGLKYGAQISLMPTTKVSTISSFTGSHLFVESDFGKVEAGSPYDAGAKMRITGYDVIAATGDGWADYAKLDGTKMQHNDVAPEFVTFKEYFFDATFKSSSDRLNDGTEPPRLISYYTPEMSGFRFGVSYIPDSSNNGTSKYNVSVTGVDTSEVSTNSYTSKFTLNRNVKDAFAAGTSYEQNLSDGVDLKLALTGEYGKSAAKATEVRDFGGGNTQTFTYKISNLATYNIGGILSVGNFSYALSYGSLGKSLTVKEYHKNGRNTLYYNGGVTYGQGPFKASLSYFRSQRFKNNVDAVTLGTDYKIAQGIQPYAELTYFQAKGKPVYYSTTPKTKTSGAVAIIGAKVKF